MQLFAAKSILALSFSDLCILDVHSGAPARARTQRKEKALSVYMTRYCTRKGFQPRGSETAG